MAIAKAGLRAGDHATTDREVDQAIALIKDDPGMTPASPGDEIVDGIAQAGDLNSALQVLQKIKPRYGIAARALAEQLAFKGDLPGAIAAIDTVGITGEATRSECMGAPAVGRFRAGDLRQALACYALCSERSFEGSQYGAVLSAVAQKGDMPLLMHYLNVPRIAGLATLRLQANDKPGARLIAQRGVESALVTPSLYSELPGLLPLLTALAPEDAMKVALSFRSRSAQGQFGPQSLHLKESDLVPVPPLKGFEDVTSYIRNISNPALQDQVIQNVIFVLISPDAIVSRAE